MAAPPVAFACVDGTDVAIWPAYAPKHGLVMASLDEPRVLWWARDGGLEGAGAVVAVAAEAEGRIAAATANGALFLLSARSRRDASTGLGGRRRRGAPRRAGGCGRRGRRGRPPGGLAPVVARWGFDGDDAAPERFRSARALVFGSTASSAVAVDFGTGPAEPRLALGDAAPPGGFGRRASRAALAAVFDEAGGRVVAFDGAWDSPPAEASLDDDAQTLKTAEEAAARVAARARAPGAGSPRETSRRGRLPRRRRPRGGARHGLPRRRRRRGDRGPRRRRARARAGAGFPAARGPRASRARARTPAARATRATCSRRRPSTATGSCWTRGSSPAVCARRFAARAPTGRGSGGARARPGIVGGAAAALLVLGGQGSLVVYACFRRANGAWAWVAEAAAGGQLGAARRARRARVPRGRARAAAAFGDGRVVLWRRRAGAARPRLDAVATGWPRRGPWRAAASARRRARARGRGGRRRRALRRRRRAARRDGRRRRRRARLRARGRARRAAAGGARGARARVVPRRGGADDDGRSPGETWRLVARLDHAAPLAGVALATLRARDAGQRFARARAAARRARAAAVAGVAAAPEGHSDDDEAGDDGDDASRVAAAAESARRSPRHSFGAARARRGRRRRALFPAAALAALLDPARADLAAEACDAAPGRVAGDPGKRRGGARPRSRGPRRLRRAPPSMLDGFDAAPPGREPPAARAARRRDDEVGRSRSGDESDTPPDGNEVLALELLTAAAALGAAARRLARDAARAARSAGCAARGRAPPQRAADAAAFCDTFGVPRRALRDAALAGHAIIRVSAEGGGLRYTSGKLGPRPSLLAMLAEISDRLEPHGLASARGARRAAAGGPRAGAPSDWPNASLDGALPPRSDLPSSLPSNRSLASSDRAAGGAAAGRRAAAHAGAPRRRAAARRGGPAEGDGAGDGHVLAQLLHPRSGVTLTPPRLPTWGGAASRGTLVSARASPDGAAAWLVDHAHDGDRAAALGRLEHWQDARVVAAVAPVGAGEPARKDDRASGASPKAEAGGDRQLRFIDAWEVEPIDDDDMGASLLRTSALGRRCPGGSGASWFVRIRISLRFLLVAMAHDPDAKRPPPQQTPEPRTQRLTSSFSDLGDAISDAASEA
ncbi:hypothetical protein SO694_00013260 [Aureococcus anophagefferens]|uniref:Uncharacterized protein n=1 Tax=Aureococcus anophagefferens TaxID=44056 RepID=A0ABR1G0Y8_AURAN